MPLPMTPHKPLYRWKFPSNCVFGPSPNSWRYVDGDPTHPITDAVVEPVTSEMMDDMLTERYEQGVHDTWAETQADVRDGFAAKALQGLLVGAPDEHGYETVRRRVETAYSYAAEMMKVRARVSAPGAVEGER